MEIPDEILTVEERAQFALRSLYRSRGYERFVMGRFEEYDLYAQNKEFLVSDNVITFTDVNGRLMALKPDVTLSVIKSTRDDDRSCSKLYYNESVYRVPRGERAFKEITQIGVECIGNVEAAHVAEAIRLAVESLLALNARAVLDISHMGLVSAVLDATGADAMTKRELLSFMEARNLPALENACGEKGLDGKSASLLMSLMSCYGTPERVFPRLADMFGAGGFGDAWTRYAEVMELLCRDSLQEHMRVNFSIVNDVDYYDGFVFKGYVEGVPQRVLSGGQYDGLMQKMKRTSKAIGFAMYLDLAEYLTASFSPDLGEGARSIGGSPC